jgi:acylphosphatase
MIRRTVVYTGTVQGVGFRATAQRFARGFPVSGWVRNLPNGNVELAVEGQEADVDAFLAKLAQRMAGYVTNVQIAADAATGEWSGFDIVR